MNGYLRILALLHSEYLSCLGFEGRRLYQVAKNYSMQISIKCDKCENYYRLFCLKLPTPIGFTGTGVCHK
jgi:hypothetical protein